VKNKGKATELQRGLVPWLIGKYGMSYKSAKLEVVKDMVEAIIDRDNLLDVAVPCHKLGRIMLSDSTLLLKQPSWQQVCLRS
jgi:hypothetical protein